MALSSWTLDINIPGDAPRKAKNLADELQRAEANQKRLNQRIEEHKRAIAGLRQTAQAHRAFFAEQLASRQAEITNIRKVISMLQSMPKFTAEGLPWGKAEKAAHQEAIKFQKQRIAELQNESNAIKAFSNTEQRSYKNSIQSKQDHLRLSKSALTEVKTTTRALNQQARQVDVLTHHWQKFSLIFGRVVHALTSFVIISAVTRVFTGFFTSLIRSNQLLEALDARLRALAPTTEEFLELQQGLEAFTVKTPFKVEEVVESTALLKAFGVQVLENMKVVGDWATAVGRDLADTAVAFGKIAAYSPRTTLLLSTRGFSLAAFESYVARYGDRVKALNKLIQDTFGGTAERVSRTFQGLLSNISDLWNFVSRTIGKPLFEGLKQDIQFIYNLLTRLNESSKKTLSIFGEIVNITVRAGGFIAISVILAIIVSKVWSLVIALRSANLAAIIFTKSFAWAAVITTMVAVVYRWFQIRDAVNEAADAQAKFSVLSKDDHSERMAQLERMIEALGRQKSIWNDIKDIIEFITFSTIRGFPLGLIELGKRNKVLERQQEILKQQVEQERLSLSEQKRKLVILNAQVNAMTDFTTAQKVAEFGLQSFLKRLAIATRAQAEMLKMPTVTTRGEIPPTQQKLWEAAQKEAISIWLRGIAEPMRIEKAVAELKKLFEKSVLAPGADLMRTKEFFQDLIQTLEEMARLGKQAKETQSKVKELQDEFDPHKLQTYRLRVAELTNQVGDLERALVLEKAAITGDERRALEDQLRVLKDEYVNLGSQIKAMRDRRDLEAFCLTATEMVEIETDALELESKRTKNLQDQLALLKEIYRTSNSWGEAFQKQLQEVQNRSKVWRETIIGAFEELLRDVGKGLIEELLFGTRREQLTDQINDLRFKLLELQKERAGIQVVEDQEVSLLSRINELERERANIIRTLLLDSLNKVLSKFQDMAIDELLKIIYKPFAVTDQLKEIEGIEKSISLIRQSGGIALIATSMRDYQIGLDRLATEREIAFLKGVGGLGIGLGENLGTRVPEIPPPIPSDYIASSGNISISFNGPVYGMNDFKKQVDSAIKEIRRSIV